ncbi:16416_t:CDS:2 [Gigaspora margarita]|uniref:16416_t:CDS:1 n=1 Tax=Gigaspora margarita TaxID=4874 RepID=A0ABN7VY44_GIGMA|nr:16416_t:CDS:2 [Gigaspora margarita]
MELPPNLVITKYQSTQLVDFQLEVWNRTSIIPPKPTITIYTDVSLTGLEQQNLIGESFLDSYFKSSVQDDYKPSDTLFNNTRMDNGLMVPSTNEDPNRLSYTTSNT